MHINRKRGEFRLQNLEFSSEPVWSAVMHLREVIVELNDSFVEMVLCVLMIRCTDGFSGQCLSCNHRRRRGASC